MGRNEMVRDGQGRPVFIDDKKKRREAFSTAKKGLFKKAMELSMRCGSDVAVLIKQDGKLYKYADGDVLTTLGEDTYEDKDNSDYSAMVSKKRKAVSTVDCSEKRTKTDDSTEDSAEDCSEKKGGGCSVQ